MNDSMYEELIRGIRTALEGQVVRIILYGSVARGTNAPDSDVDIAVCVNDRIEQSANERLSDAIVDLNLKYDKAFSIIDIEESLYQEWRAVTPFYQNVDRDGIILWAAA